METKKFSVEWFIGIVVLSGTVALGINVLAGPMLVFRLIMGIALGYVLSRAYTGFAGSVNRSYNTGSTKLMRAMVMMFFLTAVVVAGMLMFNVNAETGEPIIKFGLWVNPINMGLLIGGILFGFGMTFSSCCASGVMTDLVTDLPKALITLLFFGMGVFLGFPIQNTASWVSDSWLHTASYENGVFFPDLFKGTPLNGYLASIILTGVLCLLVVYAAYKYEAYRKQKGTYSQVLSEAASEKAEQEVVPTSKEELNGYIYNRVFVRPWTLKTGAFLLVILFSVMFAVTKSGWGASTPYGMWFAKLLMLVGMSPESLASFTHMAPESFTAPFLSNGVTVQNLGIIVGTLVYTCTSGQMAKTAKNFFAYPKWQYLLFVMGGFLMGFGTRLSNGCNVGALYTPIANFSLSGWIFFAVLVLGGVLGNIFQKWLFKTMHSGNA